MVGFKAEETGALFFAGSGAAEVEDLCVVGAAAAVELVVAGHGESADGAARELHGRLAGALDAEEVFVDLDLVANVIDVAEMDGVVGVKGGHVGGDARGLFGTGAPVAGDGDADGVMAGGGVERVDAVVAVEGIGGERFVAAGEDAADVFADPGPGALHEDVEQRIAADVAGLGERALHVGEDGVAAEKRDVAGARDVPGFVTVLGHAMGWMQMIVALKCKGSGCADCYELQESERVGRSVCSFQLSVCS